MDGSGVDDGQDNHRELTQASYQLYIRAGPWDDG